MNETSCLTVVANLAWLNTLVHKGCVKWDIYCGRNKSLILHLYSVEKDYG